MSNKEIRSLQEQLNAAHNTIAVQHTLLQAINIENNQLKEAFEIILFHHDAQRKWLKEIILRCETATNGQIDLLWLHKNTQEVLNKETEFKSINDQPKKI